MEVTQQQAYDAALMLIGRLTIEQHFYQAEMQRLSAAHAPARAEDSSSDS